MTNVTVGSFAHLASGESQWKNKAKTRVRSGRVDIDTDFHRSRWSKFLEVLSIVVIRYTVLFLIFPTSINREYCSCSLNYLLAFVNSTSRVVRRGAGALFAHAVKNNSWLRRFASRVSQRRRDVWRRQHGIVVYLLERSIVENTFDHSTVNKHTCGMCYHVTTSSRIYAECSARKVVEERQKGMKERLDIRPVRLEDRTAPPRHAEKTKQLFPMPSFLPSSKVINLPSEIF